MKINSIVEHQFKVAQISLARPTATRMWLVNICAFLVVVQSALSDGYFSLLIAISAVFAAVLTEFLILAVSGRWKTLKDGSAVTTALILVLLLPNTISPFFAAAGAVFAIAVIKHSFGGLGANWLNPAAGGWLFVNLSWPASFRAALEDSHLSLLYGDLIQARASGGNSPLDVSAFLAETNPGVDSFASFLNNTIFAIIPAELPLGHLELFVSSSPGIIADRGILLLLLGTIILCATQANRFLIPATFLAVFGILVRIAGDIPFGGEVGSGDVLFALGSGGTLVVAFFLASDPATSAKSIRGMFVTAALAGGIAFLFRYFGAEPYGAVFALLFINAMLPLIRIVESNRFYEKQGKTT